MSCSDSLNKLASENDDCRIIYDEGNRIVYDPSLSLIDDGVPMTAARRIFKRYTMRSALSLQNAVEKKLERSRSPDSRLNRLWKRLKNIDSDDEDHRKDDLESGAHLKTLSISANASPKRHSPAVNGLHQHLSNSVSTTPNNFHRNGYLRINGIPKQNDEHGLLAGGKRHYPKEQAALSDGNLHVTSNF